MALNTKRRVFVEEYLRCWNASKAAKRAGYAHPGQQGHRLLKNVEIQELIKERIQTKAMSADEVLLRLAEQARADIADFIDTEVPGGILDLEMAEDRGVTHLIKSISWSTRGVRLELYDAQAALVHIGRHLGLFKDRIEYSWRDEARREGIDPDAVYKQLVQEFQAAMVGEGGSGGLAGSETDSRARSEK